MVKLFKKLRGNLKEAVLLGLLLTVISLLATIVCSDGSNAVTVQSDLSGVKFFCWTDSLSTSTTVADKSYTGSADPDIFYYTAIHPVGASVFVKVAFNAQDTTFVLPNKRFFRVGDGEYLTFGPNTPFYKIRYKTVSGTGALFILGARRVAQ
jgi:hypothetical protein